MTRRITALAAIAASSLIASTTFAIATADGAFAGRPGHHPSERIAKIVGDHESVHLYAAPDFHADTIGSVHTGVHVSILDSAHDADGNTWFYISTNGKHGWVPAVSVHH
jgi:hypothetical protein